MIIISPLFTSIPHLALKDRSVWLVFLIALIFLVLSHKATSKKNKSKVKRPLISVMPYSGLPPPPN